MFTQLNPPIPLDTPKGHGMAYAVIDYGPDYDLLWVVFDDATGECWTWGNPLVRAVRNITFGRRLREAEFRRKLGGDSQGFEGNHGVSEETHR